MNNSITSLYDITHIIRNIYATRQAKANDNILFKEPWFDSHCLNLWNKSFAAFKKYRKDVNCGISKRIYKDSIKLYNKKL